MSEISNPNGGISMFGRDAHMIDLIVKHFIFAILHVILWIQCSLLYFLEREFAYVNPFTPVHLLAYEQNLIFVAALYFLLFAYLF